ncbi:MAG: hypothetical protein MN733_25885 [Nitrososphaera sp.]|nr:hypothetical protein [Nitrososphaera sp.]
MTNMNQRANEILSAWRTRIERDMTGKRGVVSKRELIAAMAQRCSQASAYQTSARQDWQERKQYKMERAGKRLAQLAGYESDEHGTYVRGDYVSVTVRDYIPYPQSVQVPFCDLGRRGLALVNVNRKRVYAKSSKWYPSYANAAFLVGRNEAGTYFAHPVRRDCTTVRGALDWIWQGKAEQIVQRQGDIALVVGTGPKLPSLPAGHSVIAGEIIHATHPALPMPGKGQRVIVARRAQFFTMGTRD